MLNILDFGASPDKPDNTDEIQLALNAAGLQRETVWVPSVGEFKINALRSVRPQSFTSFKIDGVLRALPTNERDYAVVDVRDVSDVSVFGTGVIAGERYQHLPIKEQGRHGTCLQILNSTNIRVADLKLREGWGDGLYLQNIKSGMIDGVVCSDNARNGCSIISADTLAIQNCTFSLTHSEGPYPQAGIDIEPDLPDQALVNIFISKNNFVANKGAGCYIAFQPAANRHKVIVAGNTFYQHYKDGSGPPIGGRNSPLANFLYATCRWVPGYDWWGFTTEYTLP